MYTTGKIRRWIMVEAKQGKIMIVMERKSGTKRRGRGSRGRGGGGSLRSRADSAFQ